MGIYGFLGVYRCLWASGSTGINGYRGSLCVLYLNMNNIVSFKNFRRFKNLRKCLKSQMCYKKRVCTTEERGFIDSFVFSTRNKVPFLLHWTYTCRT